MLASEAVFEADTMVAFDRAAAVTPPCVERMAVCVPAATLAAIVLAASIQGDLALVVTRQLAALAAAEAG